MRHVYVTLIKGLVARSWLELKCVGAITGIKGEYLNCVLQRVGDGQGEASLLKGQLVGFGILVLSQTEFYAKLSLAQVCSGEKFLMKEAFAISGLIS